MHETQNRDVNKIQNSVIHNADIEWQQGEKIKYFLQRCFEVGHYISIIWLYYIFERKNKSFGIFQLWDLV